MADLLKINDWKMKNRIIHTLKPEIETELETPIRISSNSSQGLITLEVGVAVHILTLDDVDTLKAVLETHTREIRDEQTKKRWERWRLRW